MKKKIIIIICIILFIIAMCTASYFYIKQNQDNSSLKNYSSDLSFYLESGNLYVKNTLDNKFVKVPGDFSQMSILDYQDENHKSNSQTIGGVYFYYRLNGKTYLVRSNNLEDWTIKNIDIPTTAKIKYIRIATNYGYIFYIDENKTGYILKTTTDGNYWNKIQTPFKLNENCELKFLNEFGSTVDGFLTVSSEDGAKCDLYAIDDFSEQTLKKVDISSLVEDSSELNYYHMPSPYLNNQKSVNYILLEVGKDKDDFDTKRFVSMTSSNNWITEKQYYDNLSEEKDRNNAIIFNYNKRVDDLDSNIFLKDFENYSEKSNEIKISESKAKEIAEYGFTESAARIAGEGIDDTKNSYIKIEEVYPNNYFTRKYREYDKIYNSYKRKSYIVTKENEMGNGVSVYVDVTTGLIIGGTAFGD